MDQTISPPTDDVKDNTRASKEPTQGVRERSQDKTSSSRRLPRTPTTAKATIRTGKQQLPGDGERSHNMILRLRRSLRPRKNEIKSERTVPHPGLSLFSLSKSWSQLCPKGGPKLVQKFVQKLVQSWSKVGLKLAGLEALVWLESPWFK